MPESTWLLKATGWDGKPILIETHRHRPDERRTARIFARADVHDVAVIEQASNSTGARHGNGRFR